MTKLRFNAATPAMRHAAIAFAFAFSPIAHGDRYLAEAAERRAGSVGAGHSPGAGGSEREGAGHGPGFGAVLPGDPPTLTEARTGAVALR